MIRDGNENTEALSSFYFDWIYECGQSFMQLKQKEKKNYKLCPTQVYILLWHKTLLWITGSTDLHWDTWF